MKHNHTGSCEYILQAYACYMIVNHKCVLGAGT